MKILNRYFNIGGLCNAAKNYMLPAAKRLPEVMKLIAKEQYFVIHAQRQCGKTTAFQALARQNRGLAFRLRSRHDEAVGREAFSRRRCRRRQDRPSFQMLKRFFQARQAEE